MSYVYWKGGTGATKSDPSTQANWVDSTGTQISNTTWNSGDLSAHDIIFQIEKNIAPTDPVGIIFDGSPSSHTWNTLTIIYDDDAKWYEMLKFENSATTLILSGMDIRKSQMFSATAACTIKFTGIPHFNSIRRAKGSTTGTVGGGNDNADLYIKLVDDKDEEINLFTYRTQDYAGTALSQNSYTTAGIFKDKASRGHFTFLFEPPNDSILVLDNGIYPKMTFDCASTNTATLSFDDIHTSYNQYSNASEAVDMLKLTVDTSFDVKPSDHSLRNKRKHIKLSNGYALSCATFDMGYATLEITPSTATEGDPSYYIPSSDTNRFGPTVSSTQAMGMTVKYTKLIIGSPVNEKYKLTIANNCIVTCEELHIKSGGRLYGPTYGSSDSAEIHCLSTPKIEGDWNFSEISTGIYRASGTTPTLPVSMGGTGLTSIGTQGQVLAVKSNGQGLEWRADSTISNTFILVGEESDNYISSSAAAGNANGYVFSFGNGAQNSDKNNSGSDIGVILPVACTLSRVDITFGNIGNRADSTNQTITVYKNGASTTTTLLYNSSGSGNDPFKRNFASLSGNGLSYAAGDTFNLRATGLSGYTETQVGPARMTAYFTVN